MLYREQVCPCLHTTTNWAILTEHNFVLDGYGNTLWLIDVATNVPTEASLDETTSTGRPIPFPRLITCRDGRIPLSFFAFLSLPKSAICEWILQWEECFPPNSGGFGSNSRDAAWLAGLCRTAFQGKISMTDV